MVAMEQSEPKAMGYIEPIVQLTCLDIMPRTSKRKTSLGSIPLEEMERAANDQEWKVHQISGKREKY